MKQRLLLSVAAILETATECKKVLQYVNSDDADTKQEKEYVPQSIIGRLQQLYYNIENLQLRMCVVAPMKAGKSTIINGILGQSVLPTRNVAMTVIPTEVVLNVSKESSSTQPAPYLSLDQQLINELWSMQNEVREYLKKNGLDRVATLPHLTEFATEIQNGSDDLQMLEQMYSGVDLIRKKLQHINDLIRLHELLLPSETNRKSRSLFHVLPRITAPYTALGNENSTNQSMGNLVIIDTPGANEDTTTSFLKELVERELNKAAVILVVLDFTVLNTKADRMIKDEIDKIRQSKRNGDDALFALVNKVDQRRKADMKPDEVRDFVKTHLKIGQNDQNSIMENRVFEVQALRALLAKQFFLEVEAVGDSAKPFKIDELPSGSDFVAEAYGATYDEKLERSKDDVTKDATTLWGKSGYEKFLNEAIETLIKRAAPRIIESALCSIHFNMRELRENLSTRERMLDAKVSHLLSRIRALQRDRDKMTAVMQAQKSTVNKFQAEMKAKFKIQFVEVKSEGVKQLATVFECLNRDNGALALQTHIPQASWEGSDSFTRRLAAGVVRLALSFSSLMDKIKNIVFESADNAHRWIRSIERDVSNIAEDAVSSIRDKLDTQCSDVCTELNQHLHSITQKIIQNTQNEFLESFNVVLEKPRMLEVHFAEEPMSVMKVHKTYKPWWTLGLISVTYEDEIKEGTSYHVKLSSFERHCQQIFEANMAALEKGLNEYLHGALQVTFDTHFNELQSTLEKYEFYLTQSMQDQQRTADEKARFRQKLLQLRDNVDKQREVVSKIQQDFRTQFRDTMVQPL